MTRIKRKTTPILLCILIFAIIISSLIILFTKKLSNDVFSISNIGFEDVITCIGYSSPIGTFFWILWDNCIWKIPIIQRITKVPNLSGSWVGTYKRTSSTSDGNNHDYNIDIYQTYSRISCHTYQERGSSSGSLCELYTKTNDNIVGIAFFWECNPTPPDLPFYGYSYMDYCGELDVSNRTSKLEGTYFTNKIPVQSKGVIVVHFRSRKHAKRYIINQRK